MGDNKKENEELKNKNLQDKKASDEQKEENKQKQQEMVPKQDYDELDDRYKRILAEFENFKKRSNKERESLYNSILSDIVEVILPVVDNLENAVKAETADEEYKKGVELVLKQLQDVLQARGVQEIKALRRNI